MAELLISPMWSFDISFLSYIAAGATLLAALVLLLFFMPMMRRVITLARKETDCMVPDAEDCPDVTVMVYAHNDAWNLPTLIDDIFAQDYPGKVEVVVVNDIAADNTEDTVRELQLKYPSLYLTFMPERSRNLSRKKLAVTIGLKAARYDVVLLTCGNCHIDSPDWLRRMMRHVAAGKDVVIGYATLRDLDGGYSNDIGSRLRSFDSVWDALRYLSTAISGHPCRGNGNNLVYRKHLFFENNGFARSLNLNFGDDDILVNEIANADNCAVEISRQSIMEARESRPGVVYELEKLRHDFTAKFLPRRQRLAMGLYCCMAWTWLLGSAGTIVFGLPSLIPACYVALVGIGLWIPLMIAWRNASRVLMASHAALITMPLLMLWHPVYNLRYRIIGKKQRRENFTWSKV